MTAVAYDVRQWTRTHPYATMIHDGGGCKIITGIVDFTKKLPIYSASAQAADLVPGAQFGTLATDTIRIVTIPANSFVVGARVKTTTVNGGTCTVELGDSATVAGFATAANIAAALNTFSNNATTTPAYGAGKFYVADDYLKLTTNHTTAVAVVNFQIVLLDLTLPGLTWIPT